MKARRSLAAKEYATGRHHLTETAELLRDLYPAYPELLVRSAAGVTLPTGSDIEEAAMIAPLVAEIAEEASMIVPLVAGIAANAGQPRSPRRDSGTLHSEALEKTDAWIAAIVQVRDTLGQGLLAQLRLVRHATEISPDR